ncbi:MAG: class I SAM-dependent methyltransferase [Candidatus Woesearchaeota archaeon]
MANINIEKVEKILKQDYKYYDQDKVKYQFDKRLNYDIKLFLIQELKKDFKVLDVGCGDGHTLINLSKHFKLGVGIDNDKHRISLAKKNKSSSKTINVSFRLAKSYDIPFKNEEFDFVFSERGPISGSTVNVQSALRVLKKNGLLFEETIGELDNQETNEIFHRGQQYRKYQHMNRIDEVKVLFERNGVDIRIINNLVSKIIFPNIYEWLKYQCAVWTYNKVKKPSIDEMNKIEDFFLTNRNEENQIVITKHRVWIGGVKVANPPQYWEFKHFE